MAFYADFVGALGNMTVTGVTKKMTSPPRQVSTAQLPLQFPRLPAGTNSVETLSSTTALKRGTCELVILIEAVGQSTLPLNFALALTLLDNLDAALGTLAASGTVDDWAIRQDAEVLADGTQFWALVATVRGSGV